METASSDQFDVVETAVRMRLRGVVTLAVCRRVLRRMSEAGRYTGTTGGLVDMRSAVLAISIDQYLQLLREIITNPVRVPVAFVAAGAILNVASAHEVTMRRHGLSHRFFADSQAAEQWLGRQVQQPRSPRGVFAPLPS